MLLNGNEKENVGKLLLFTFYKIFLERENCCLSQQQIIIDVGRQDTPQASTNESVRLFQSKYEKLMEKKPNSSDCNHNSKISCLVIYDERRVRNFECNNKVGGLHRNRHRDAYDKLL